MRVDFALIQRFALAERRRGLQPTTIDSRARNYRLFVRTLDPLTLSVVTRADVEVFLDSRGLCNRARYRWLSDLHVFYKWMVTEGYVTDDPTEKIERPPLPKLLPRPIGSDDLGAAIERASTMVRCWLLLAAYEGMRCIEIARLTWEDVLDGQDPPVLLARGKGDKMRIIPLHPDVTGALKLLPGRRSGPVFRQPDGRPRTATMISQQGNEYLHSLGITSTMHKLRHWFGTNVYRTSGRDVLLVRDLLGHSSVSTTEVYAAFDRARAPEAVNQLTAYA